jgi:hypothetical protein
MLDCARRFGQAISASCRPITRERLCPDRLRPCFRGASSCAAFSPPWASMLARSIPSSEAIDPLRARPLGNGRLLAPFIGFAEASRRYTADL